MPPICLTIGFDADDTLWHNETIFERVHERFQTLLPGITTLRPWTGRSLRPRCGTWSSTATA